MLPSRDFSESIYVDRKCPINIPMQFLFSVDYKYHYEKFLPNSVDLMKNLQQTHNFDNKKNSGMIVITKKLSSKY